MVDLVDETLKDLNVDKGNAPVEMSSIPLPNVKQVIRYISRQNLTDVNANVFSVWEVDEYLNQLNLQGYDLFETHYLGENPEGFGMLYVLKLKI